VLFRSEEIKEPCKTSMSFVEELRLLATKRHPWIILLQQKYGVPCLNDLATLYPDKLNFEKELRVLFGRFASFLFECSTESAVSNPGTRGVILSTLKKLEFR